MTGATSFNPHKEEDEGYRAAAAGGTLADNIYPFGTIRHEDWRRGWQIRTEEARRPIGLGQGHGQEDEGYRAAEAGQPLAENPHPPGTIRHEHWRRGWRIKTDEVRRAARMAALGSL
jgi:hypothetical protein